ncbi:3,4-dihydroxyphenylacetaldehyde synthase 2 [Phlebotomus argentipes]|uniref:3,4-dihydroxyphenylacetaldehyde synthase 2 n=1 Tax=Phlebotomus argentipes TaxID=94469 RepID=UPI0028936267|nr:3,4-dihydroxyphenylacetaldehyde synthase 2 [Phlebotomus argentipes]
MDVNEFREFGKAAVDFVADYLENIRDQDVLPSVHPGYLHKFLPEVLPEQPENWREVMKEMEKFILPGITHWQSPNFHAYFPTACSYPAIVGELLSSGFGIVGFNWICSPACTELEVIVMDWLGKLLGLPEEFLNCHNGPGGGVIQGSASESILIAVLAAREQSVRKMKIENPEMSESDVRGRLVAYSSDQSNSAVEKAGILSAMPMRLLTTDGQCTLRGDTLRRAIEEDLAAGNIPSICVATLGTTGTCAFDDIEEIGQVCREFNVWLHIDAAYAGAAFCCPEYRHLMKGVELAESFNFNVHKWMMVNFDCCAMWLKNADLLVQAFNVDRIYLQHRYQGQSKAPDYRHWQIPLGRRFRALKLWITLRTVGAEAIRHHIRHQIHLAQHFQALITTDDRFEVIGEATMGLVCFRLRNGCAATKKLLEKITERKKIYMIHGNVQEKLVIRFAICGRDPQVKDVDFAVEEILLALTEVQIAAEEVSEKLRDRFSKEITIMSSEERLQ